VGTETPGADLHLARLTPDFARFQAVLGWRIKETAQWAPFARLRDIHGWKRLIRAAEQCDPGARWASDMEKLCRQYALTEAESIKEAEARERMASAPKPQNPAQSAKLFSEIRKRIGV
jgi:hypothetical protein